MRFAHRARLRGDYCLERRHPDARASASVQNHRSPFDVSMRVPPTAPWRSTSSQGCPQGVVRRDHPRIADEHTLFDALDLLAEEWRR